MSRNVFPFERIFLGIACCWIALSSLPAAAVPYEVPSKARTLSFPRDHGSHPTFRTEWWYYTGHLVPVGHDLFTSRERYGFQLTFFRSAGTPEVSPNLWDQRFLAHGALTDLARNQFLHHAVYGPGSLGVAGADEGRLRVWNNRWSATEIGDQHILKYTLPPTDTTPETLVQLRAEPTREPLLHGERSVSRKGDCPTCLSHYYSLPGLRLRGEIIRGGTVVPVEGLGWMDHEFMSTPLKSDQVGWDWLSLQFRDGRSLMLFRVRGKDASGDWFGGTVDKQGERFNLAAGDFTMEPIRFWKSQKSLGLYPVDWKIRIPAHSIDLVITTIRDDQELTNAAPPPPLLSEEGSTDRGREEVPTYWEGAVVSTDRSAIGYLELTGYDKPIGKVL